MTIDEELLAQAKSTAAATGRTLGDVVNDALRVLFSKHPEDHEVPLTLPVFGDPEATPLVDILDRDALAVALGDDRL